MLAKKLGYTVAREDLTGLIQVLQETVQRSQDNAHHNGLLQDKKMNKSADHEDQDTLAMVDPRDTSPKAQHVVQETWRRQAIEELDAHDEDFKADQDIVEKLNTKKSAQKILRISGGDLAPLTAPNDRCKP